MLNGPAARSSSPFSGTPRRRDVVYIRLVIEEREQAKLCWGQRWSWQEQQLPPDRRSPTLVLTAEVDQPDPVDVTAIRAAIRLVVARHAAMRTTVTVGGDGLPRQEIWPVEAEEYSIEQFDDVAQGRQWLHEDFDIASAWPFRVGLLGSDRAQNVIGVAAHHVATDRYGLDLFCRELQAAVRAISRRQAPAAESPARQPADIAAFEASAAGAAVNERSIRYWLRHHEELSEQLGTLAARFDQPSDASHVAQTVSADARKRLSELAAAARAGEPAVAVAVVADTLADYLGRSSVIMFMISANRHLPGVRHSVCSLAQAGLVRIDVPEPRRVERLIPAASKGALTALHHAYYDPDVLSARQRAMGAGGHQPPVTPPSVNVMSADRLVRYPSGWIPGGDAPSTRLEQVPRPCSGLNFHVTMTGSCLSIELRAGTHLLPAGDCEALVTAAMERILTSVTAA